MFRAHHHPIRRGRTTLQATIGSHNPWQAKLPCMQLQDADRITRLSTLDHARAQLPCMDGGDIYMLILNHLMTPTIRKSAMQTFSLLLLCSPQAKPGRQSTEHQARDREETAMSQQRRADTQTFELLMALDLGLPQI